MSKYKSAVEILNRMKSHALDIKVDLEVFEKMATSELEEKFGLGPVDLIEKRKELILLNSYLEEWSGE